ncbi:hypothetical protein [Lewinella sp. IMCC34183]|uniref:hypothetical protein n=1 Tax=Lewinella sp. IMCC34183 TaxID=2248762 RepID=UPI000E239166|nr:hypothetical protein [Lewinella sp. IMCC34183]
MANKPLNEDFTPPTSAVSTFRGNPRRQLYPAHTTLYRFVTPGQNEILGQYWMSRDLYKSICGFAKGKLSKGEVARAWGAVNENWNEKMSCVVKVRLNRDAYGWTGPARHQLSRQGANVLFMGNGEQIYLPNLKGADVTHEHFEYAGS